MPIPKPNSGENESDFVSRCISKIIDEYDQDQAAAICYNSWRDQEKMSFKSDLFVLQPKKTENRGMYLARCSNNAKMRKQFPAMKERMGFCLNSFNEYYKYWSKIEMGAVPEDSALGNCIAKEKSKGFDYKEAYAHCSSKLGNKPLGSGQQINLNQDLIVEPVEFGEMDIYGYKTKYFYICPGAQATFENIMQDSIDEETIGMVRTAAQVADNVFAIEARVVDAKKATNDDVSMATLLVQDFKDIIDEIMEETGSMYDVSYMDGHIETIKKYFS